MHYRLPLTVVFLCYHLVLGSEEITDNESSDPSSDPSLHRVRRGGLSMLRLGRGLQMLRLGKRALPMLRLGRSASDGLSEDEVQYLLSLVRNTRQVPLPRYGKDLEYMLRNALKNAELNSAMFDDGDVPSYDFGYDLGTAPERHIRPAPRPGMRYRRSVDTENEQSSEDNMRIKRVPPVARIGKEIEGEEGEDEEMVKRAMRMLRLGRGMRMLRLGKRPMTADDEYTEEEKRALRLLRLGKRPFKMLRLGRSEYDENDDDKRGLRLLRLGRNSDNAES